MKFRHLFLFGLLASLGLHSLLLLGLQSVPDSWMWWNQPDPRIAEIVIIEKNPATAPPKDRQVVRDVTPPDRQKDDKADDEARFLSARQQRVLQETKARQTGLTQNNRSLPQNSWLRRWNEEQNRRLGEKNAAAAKDGYEPIPLPRPDGRAVAFEDAPSTVGEVLPDDVALGDFTALNTDRFKFYSFYSRVEDLVRFRWEQGLKQAVDSFPQEYLLNVVGKKNWFTRIEFLLTPDGRFHSARIQQECGIKRFDFAAVGAFRDAAVFPNPPAEMVGPDGFIHLQYSFTVRWSPGALVHR
ncbi:MAG: energy transducer TonB [Bdellovibrionaceae bacterium]|nr:energy transducer TonB [Pseudobdellovibrionaceae bacterium]MBX3034825.1 energy transducer TonB [Pseudobdellovibrionaceae bacterium]